MFLKCGEHITPSTIAFSFVDIIFLSEPIATENKLTWL